MISTRGRYAIRVMLDIAKNQQDAYVPMKDVVKRQNLSLKYLEQILPDLTKNKLVEGVQGKGGGYRLVRKPEEYTIGEILRAAEHELAPVACLADGAKECDRRKICQTVEFWEGFYNVINEYLDSKTLADLMKKQ
jgi:Rrf2 family protein